MNKIIVCGDTHGILDTEKLSLFFDGREEEYHKDDYLIILGDVGACGFTQKGESSTREFLRKLPVTTLFIDGNHEQFEHLNSHDIKLWNGGKVHFIENDIIHLMRGQVFEIGEITFFTMGGAHSVDRWLRRTGVDWFPEEIPSYEELEEGFINLEQHNFSVDYVFSHTGPREVVTAMGYGEVSDDEMGLRQYLQRVADMTNFTGWYFGHFHTDVDVDDLYYCLYNEVVELKKSVWQVKYALVLRL